MDKPHVPESADAQTLDPWFLDLLACPACEQHLPVRLTESGDTLVCGCGRYAFPIRDGIPVLLIEEATVLDDDARPQGSRSE